MGKYLVGKGVGKIEPAAGKKILRLARCSRKMRLPKVVTGGTGLKRGFLCLFWEMGLSIQGFLSIRLITTSPTALFDEKKERKKEGKERGGGGNKIGDKDL